MVSSAGWAPSRFRQVTAFVVALVAGAIGWVAIPSLYMVLPVGWLPVTGNGNWIVAFWIGMPLALIGWSAAVGVLLMERILRKPQAVPYSRQGVRGWGALVACCFGLGAGMYASLWFLLVYAFEMYLRAPTGAWDYVVVRASLVAGLVAPTVGLIGARAGCQRWLGGSGPSGGSSPKTLGMGSAAVPPPPRDPEAPLLPASA